MSDVPPASLSEKAVQALYSFIQFNDPKLFSKLPCSDLFSFSSSGTSQAASFQEEEKYKEFKKCKEGEKKWQQEIVVLRKEKKEETKEKEKQMNYAKILQNEIKQKETEYDAKSSRLEKEKQKLKQEFERLTIQKQEVDGKITKCREELTQQEQEAKNASETQLQNFTEQKNTLEQKQLKCSEEIAKKEEEIKKITEKLAKLERCSEDLKAQSEKAEEKQKELTNSGIVTLANLKKSHEEEIKKKENQYKRELALCRAFKRDFATLTQMKDEGDQWDDELLERLGLGTERTTEENTIDFSYFGAHSKVAQRQFPDFDVVADGERFYGGTKTRVIWPYLLKKQWNIFNEFVYGPVFANDGDLLAMAWTFFILKSHKYPRADEKQLTIFIKEEDNQVLSNFPYVLWAKRFQANVKHVKDSKQWYDERKEKKNIYIIPLGAETEDTVEAVGAFAAQVRDVLNQKYDKLYLPLDSTGMLLKGIVRAKKYGNTNDPLAKTIVGVFMDQTFPRLRETYGVNIIYLNLSTNFLDTLPYETQWPDFNCAMFSTAKVYRVLKGDVTDVPNVAPKSTEKTLFWNAM